VPHVSPLHLPHRCGTVRLRLQPRPFGRRRLPPNSVSSPEPAAASRDSDDKPHTDFERLAERLVKQSAGVQEGEHVLITGGSQDQELLENIAVHVHKVGAFPLVPLKATGWRSACSTMHAQDLQRDTLMLKLAEHMDAVITVSSNLEDGVFAGADPARAAARANAGQPVMEAFIKRGCGRSRSPAAVARVKFIPRLMVPTSNWNGSPGGFPLRYGCRGSSAPASQAMAVKFQQVDVPVETAQLVRFQNRALIALALRGYLERGHRG